MGAAVGARDASTSRNGGDGTGALLGSPGAVPAAVRRRPGILSSAGGRVRHQAALARQHDRGKLLAAGVLLPHPEETGMGLSLISSLIFPAYFINPSSGNN